jgi:hypothetical protein
MCLTGCVSKKGFAGRETIYGIVTDGYHKPVPGYRLWYNGGQSVVASETGMFAFEKIRAGTGTLTGSKPGYLPLQQSVLLIDKRQMLYVSVTPVTEILDRADALFEKEAWKDAEDLLEDTLAKTAKEQDIPTGILRFYLAAALYKQKRYDQASALLAELSGLSMKKIAKTGIEPITSLFYFKLIQELSEGSQKAAEVYYDGL